VHFLDDPFDPARQVLYVRSEDVTQLVPGDGVNVTRLLAQGGIVHVREIGGDGINAWYVLPPSGWHLIDDANPRAGIRYRNPYGAITSLDFATNDYLRIIGQGRQLIQSLAIEPDLVEVELWLGSYRYCMEFGGSEESFTRGLEMVRRQAFRPIACSDEYSAW
jgi:hypothetical protein